MRVLFDTNIILDLFLDRAPFADEAAKLWQANADGRPARLCRFLSRQIYYRDCRLLRQTVLIKLQLPMTGP
jgi:predicted nucleic acid-binding protein